MMYGYVCSGRYSDVGTPLRIKAGGSGFLERYRRFAVRPYLLTVSLSVSLSKYPSVCLSTSQSHVRILPSTHTHLTTKSNPRRPSYTHTGVSGLRQELKRVVWADSPSCAAQQRSWNPVRSQTNAVRVGSATQDGERLLVWIHRDLYRPLTSNPGDNILHNGRLDVQRAGVKGHRWREERTLKTQ